MGWSRSKGSSGGHCIFSRPGTSDKPLSLSVFELFGVKGHTLLDADDWTCTLGNAAPDRVSWPDMREDACVGGIAIPDAAGTACIAACT